MSQEMSFSARANLKGIEATLKEIARQKAARRDYIVHSSRLSMSDEGELCLAGVKQFKVGDDVFTEWKDAEAVANLKDIKLEVLGDEAKLRLNRTAESQLCTKLELPIKYTDKLAVAGYHDLRSLNFTYLLQKANSKLLARTLDGKCRAVLSNGYRIIDNQDVFFAAADTLTEANAVIWDARLWDDGFEMLAVSETIAAEVKRQHKGQGDHGWAELKDGNQPDMHNAAVKIRNSETGRGGLDVCFGMLRRVCSNSVVLGKAFSIVHLGKRQHEEGLVYSDETNAAESKALWLKLRDSIKATFDRKRFETYIAKLSGLTSETVEKPELVVQNLATEYALSEERRAAILRKLFESRDLTQFGLVQAVTFQAHEAKAEEASELERIGGELVDMPQAKFRNLALAVA